MMLTYILPFQTTVLLTLLPLLTPAIAQAPGKTTRYWDCCKPSCAWPRAGITAPVRSCTGFDVVLKDVNAKSSCDGGGAYTCSDQTPWAVSDTLAYGFAAVSAVGGDAKCCGCYELSFTSGPVSGKKMVVQATNTGGDVDSMQFDLAIPAGGVGIYDGCATQWGAKPEVWGKQYGGAVTDKCSAMPKALQGGCGFRWGWMGGADNPTVDYKPVACPAEIIAKSGCARLDDKLTHAASGDSSSSNGPYSSSFGSAPASTPTPSTTCTSALASSSSSSVNGLPASSTPLTSSTDSSNVAQTTLASSTDAAVSSSSAPYSTSTDAAVSSSCTPASSTHAAVSSSSAPYSTSLSTSSTSSSSDSASAPPAPSPTTTPTDSTSTPPPSSPTTSSTPSSSSGSYESPTPTTSASLSASGSSTANSNCTTSSTMSVVADKIGVDHKIHIGGYNGTSSSGYGGTDMPAAAGKKKTGVKCRTRI